jgi:hypothetical protein
LFPAIDTSPVVNDDPITIFPVTTFGPIASAVVPPIVSTTDSILDVLTFPNVACISPVVDVIPVPAVSVPDADIFPDGAVIFPVVDVIPVPAVSVPDDDILPALVDIFPLDAVIPALVVAPDSVKGPLMVVLAPELEILTEVAVDVPILRAVPVIVVIEGVKTEVVPVIDPDADIFPDGAVIFPVVAVILPVDAVILPVVAVIPVPAVSVPDDDILPALVVIFPLDAVIPALVVAPVSVKGPFIVDALIL